LHISGIVTIIVWIVVYTGFTYTFYLPVTYECFMLYTGIPYM